jgi:hypothetical protein
VLVLDPALVPNSVDVITHTHIYIYELHFKVEPENLHDNVEPMNMEDMDGNDGENEEEKGTKGENNMQIDKPDHKLSSGDSNSKSKTSPANQEIKGGKRALFHIPLIKMGASTIQGVFAKKKVLFKVQRQR